MFEDVIAYYKKLVPHLTDKELSARQDCFSIRQLQKGAFLLKEGQVCRHVSFVNRGLLRLYYAIEGKEISIGFVSKGDYTSEYESFLTRKPGSHNIEALTNAELVDLSFDDMQLLYKSYPSFQEFGRKIAETLFIILNQRNTALLVLSPEERYRNMIINNDSILQNVPQYMLASYIGVTPEHLSRIRKKMSGH